MSDLGDYFRLVKTWGIRRKLKKQKDCQIAGRSCVNFSNCEFEGYNTVGKFTILNHCTFGLGSYISESSLLEHTSVGRFCAIGPYVHIVNGKHPTRNFVSIHPAFYSTAKQAGFTYVDRNRFEEFSYADSENGLFVKIGNDVWIGAGVLLRGGGYNC